MQHAYATVYIYQLVQYTSFLLQVKPTYNRLKNNMSKSLIAHLFWLVHLILQMSDFQLFLIFWWKLTKLTIGQNWWVSYKYTFVMWSAISGLGLGLGCLGLGLGLRLRLGGLDYNTDLYLLYGDCINPLA